MEKEYKYSFKEIIENFNYYKLVTIIELDHGDRYKLTKTDNDIRKFSRVNRGLRFMTYDNIDRFFRVIEEQPEINIQGIKNAAKLTFNFHKDSYTPKQISENFETFVELLNMQSDKQNELIRAVKQLDNKMKGE